MREETATTNLVRHLLANNPINLPAENTALLTGADAADLVGSQDGADLFLCIPQTGEFLFAHSRYLCRNSEFAALFDALEASAETKMKVIVVAPPFIQQFRLILRQIYSNDPEHCEGRLAPAEFVPILLNAQHFKVDHLIDQCFTYFEKNWSSIIYQETFSFGVINQETLVELVEVVETEANKLLTFLEWVKDVTDLTRRGEIRALVKHHVHPGSVPDGEWVNLMEKYPASFEYCFDNSRLVQIAKDYLPNEERCDEWN
ncbi:hypothetical protein BJ741DRAFT_711839 [Chytriomyces cf. hyalinus JEL632]|nr:hypothetical protein BJ741DRAFT_711839 [Chytriomyces cf. hyalinus JEL632]